MYNRRKSSYLPLNLTYRLENKSIMPGFVRIADEKVVISPSI
jgi:hypothetical protein